MHPLNTAELHSLIESKKPSFYQTDQDESGVINQTPKSMNEENDNELQNDNEQNAEELMKTNEECNHH